MVNYVVTNGWLWLIDATATDGLKLFFQKLTWSWKFKPKIKHFAGNSHMGYSLGKKFILIKVKDILFETETELEDTLKYIDDWSDSAPFTCKVQKNSDGSFVELDGTNESITVLQKDIGNNEHISPGDQDVWKIGMLILEQAG